MTIINRRITDSEGYTRFKGDQIGKGGEGAVHEFEDDIAVKIYNRPLTPHKQEKIIKMTQQYSESWSKFLAWPKELIYEGNHGPVNGFKMPRFKFHEPIHRLYNPEDRKQFFPYADWSFLLHVALNLAGAFDFIHRSKCIIGDVSERNVLVSPKEGLVKLIDCDSFQFECDEVVYKCEVFTQDYLAPELQPDGKGMKFTANHDNFGLAVMIYKLLFLGRHPYAGMYMGDDDISLSEMIAQFKYMHGLDAGRKEICPPLESVGPSILPSNVAWMFELAFTEQGVVANARPKACEWREVLRQMLHHVDTCKKNRTHKYHDSLLYWCPWCNLEGETGVKYFGSELDGKAGELIFDPDDAWNVIEKVPKPTQMKPLDINCISLRPLKLPPTPISVRILQTAKKISVLIFVACCIALACGKVLPLDFMHLLSITIIIIALEKDKTEIKMRKEALLNAETRMAEVDQRWKDDPNQREFSEVIADLKSMVEQYKKIDDNECYDQYVRGLRGGELQCYLERYRIDADKMFLLEEITHLNKIGIIYYFNITKEKIADARKEKFWNRSLESKLLNLKEEHRKMRKINITAEIGSSPFSDKKRKLENALLAGPNRLYGIRRKANTWQYLKQSEIWQAKKALEQAKVDLAVFD